MYQSRTAGLGNGRENCWSR